MKPNVEAIAAAAEAMGIDPESVERFKSFLEFDSQDVAVLKEMQAGLRDAQGRFVDAFYAHLLKFSETRALIPDEATLKRLKRTQAAYFDGLTAGEYGWDYVLDRLRVGIAHQRVGLTPKWYVGAYSQYLLNLLPEIQRLTAGEPEKTNKAVQALLKIIMFDMTLAFETYRFADKQALEYQALHDVLTGLPNRCLLRDRLQQAILDGQRENSPVALLLLDLDHFQEINDTLGHHHGDQVLRLVGRRLQATLRETDTVARWEGDEFAVLMPKTDLDGAVRAAEKIMKALEEPFVLDGFHLAVEAGFGIAVYPDHAADSETLIRRVDVARFAAKQSGSGYAVSAVDKDPHNSRSLAMMGELRRAIGDSELFLQYQPRVHLPTGKMIGVEALVRWKHPQFGLIPPDQFILPAERTGLIKPLTLWVLKEALTQCRAWQQPGHELSMAVNLSVRNLRDSRLPEQIAELLEACGVEPAHIVLEITESAIMSDPKGTMAVLKRLKEIGVRFSIDDFGTGYSSLGYLKMLPVDEIKIDKSFVVNMAKDNKDAAIVRSIIDLGQNLGLSVVAEGIENQNILELLVKLGCVEGQGYHLGRPVFAPEIGGRVAGQGFPVGGNGLENSAGGGKAALEGEKRRVSKI